MAALLFLAAASAFAQPSRGNAWPPAAFTVLLDPAHGGDDTGAHLSPAKNAPAGAVLQEKDLVLTLAQRLQSALAAQNIPATLTRDRDLTLPAAARSQAATRTGPAIPRKGSAIHPAACLSLHATASGAGVHLFTSSLPAALHPAKNSAQSAWTQPSLRLASELDSAMTRAQIPVTLGSTALEPLDAFPCPAVAVEVAPLATNGAVTTPLTDPGYQQRIVAAIAAALQSWRQDYQPGLQPSTQVRKSARTPQP